ncbi:DUF5655 domain-containing protein [Thermonema rossianum]|uniref:DUF5655 domain-containing protein n=1 Tax=Thermonema rossianum TaxID=55505 RepID=UPI00057119C7|nr:DUF5655 domain-containing protein [Thermonema rossianum]
MHIYQEQSGQLVAIKEVPFQLEKEIQTLTEANLKQVFKLELVKSEFSIQNFRIDTLAFDRETRAFVIIEYKRDKNFSVIDQGYAYLALMLNNKADFILEYNEQMSDALKRKDVDWSQSRVIFVAPSFTAYQKEAINFKDLPIELWEIRRFTNNMVLYNRVQAYGAHESIQTISKQNKEMEVVSKQVKVFTEEALLLKANPSDEIRELYEKMKNAILNLGDIEVKPRKHYIAFVGASNIVDVAVQQKSIKMWLNLSKGELDDPKGISRDVSATGHWGNGDYEIKITTDEDLEYILSLVKQSLKKNGK